MARKKRVPGREWTWNETSEGYDGVHTYEGKIVWYNFKGNPHAGGGGVSQSFHQFLTRGTNSSAPDYVVKELENFLLEHLPEYKVTCERFFNHKPPPEPSGNVLKTFDWTEGYDQEYEFTVYIYKNCIVWHLEYDKQWINPPEKAIQSLEDYLSRGAPGIFDRPSSYDSIKDFVQGLSDKEKT